MTRNKTYPNRRQPNGRRAMLVSLVAAIVIAPVSYAAADGLTAATSRPTQDAEKVNISGRWSGHHHGYGIPPGVQSDCGGKPCTFTYDIVACGNGWCGILVDDKDTCGRIGLHLADTKKVANHQPGFDGKLELAKGSAPFVVQAWYRAAITKPKKGEEAAPASITLIGATESELLLMRRSFPLHTILSRIGDSTCTLERATS